ncbi:hypothetical protein [Novosphingobium resinovorum]|uniref:Uncharacterized protein n=1 Tax=Novosphingobium resinovorum TaxID=158500 RepID=A0A1D8A531_9SPHN|nr:hypothetical protein [Novosphingobium resinovorum]AOR77196.1 hypothetical protein BES08_10875 [Novosphingobium resinovorum]
MQCASSLTVTRGTATGSETAVFVERRAADNDRVDAARVIANLLSALELQGVKPEYALDYAIIAAEMTLEDWGFDVPSAIKARMAS